MTLLWPARTVAVPGTVTTPLLLLRETTAAPTVALFKDTVHVLEALLPSVEGAQDTPVSCAGALTESAKDAEPPLRAPMSRAV